MQITQLADITGDGATHALSAATVRAKWIQFITDKANGAAVRIGDKNVTSSLGLPIAAGGGMLLPPIADLGSFYDLSTTYYNAGSGDKLYVAWA